MRSRRGLAAVAALLAVSACVPDPPVACTEIGASTGVGVTLAPEVASGTGALALQVCFDGRCRTVPVQLSPGSSTVPLDCPTADPDAACSATAVPDGTLVGFAEVAGLPAGSVEVGATLTRNGRRQGYDPIAVESVTVYPNGTACPGEGNQAQVRLTAAGLVG
jgi:hypothetical protein